MKMINIMEKVFYIQVQEQNGMKVNLKDEMNGKGTIYSANTEEKLFEGTFKNYDVIEGTLYNSDGTVRKKVNLMTQL